MSALRGKTVAVIGTGKMGQALLKGLLAKGLPRRALLGADPEAAIRRRVRQQFGIAVTEDNARVARRSDVVILAVKPQEMPGVLAGLAPHLSPRQLVVSIAAGVTLRSLQHWLPRAPLVRVMPNLPATVGCGFSAIAAGRFATARHRAMAQALFSAVGEVVELPERHFDAVTAVSGSGPAYVFFLARAWEEAARALGLPAAVGSSAVRQTLAGSVRLLQASPAPRGGASRLPSDALINQVASKGGTTEAALKVLAQRRVAAHFVDALRAAARRSKALRHRS